MPSVDFITGGGLPVGRIIEMWGEESSGKTTLALMTIATTHKTDPNSIAAFIDLEHTLDIHYAKALGVDLERLTVSQPSTIDEALVIIDLLMKTKAADIIILDSVASGDTKAAEKDDAGEQKMGDRARLMSSALRRYVAEAQSAECCLIFLNQIRMKLGVMFGNPQTTPGGEALKYYASIRLRLSKTSDKIKDADEVVIANKCKIQVQKSKVCPPFGETIVTMSYGTGIEYFYNLAELLIDQEVVTKSGAWLVLPDGQKIQGKDQLAEWLSKSPEEAKKLLDNLVNKKYRIEATNQQ